MSQETVPVIMEVPLTVYYNNKEIITLLTTPDHLAELAVGFFKSEGFIEKPADLIDVSVDEDKGAAFIKGGRDASFIAGLMEKRTVTSGCGKGTTFYHALDALQTKSPSGDFKIALEDVIELTKEINRIAMKNREAGGVHHAALAGPGGIEVIMEDIGRHNAIDKIQGYCFLKKIPASDKFLMTTGRISSEILIKAGKMGVPMIVSLSKPSLLALELAKRLKISVIGNLRGRSGYIYHDFGRIKHD